MALEALRSGHLSAGPRVARFEQELARVCGRVKALGVSSGTAALHLALLAVGVRPGDEVLTPSYVCAAVANAVRHCGATPVPVDIDPQRFTIDPAAAARARTRKTRAVVAAHMFGCPADMTGLRRALGDLPLVEDATQALGAWVGGRPVGKLAPVAVFSFYATKLLCTGSGGMLVGTASLVARARDLAEYDNRDDDRERFSYGMNELQGSLGSAQLLRYTESVRRRLRLARRYHHALRDVVGQDRLPPIPGEDAQRPGHVFYRFVVRAREGAATACRDLQGLGIEAKRPVHKPLHRLMRLDPRLYPESERAFREAVSLPLYPALRRDEADRVLQGASVVLG